MKNILMVAITLLAINITSCTNKQKTAEKVITTYMNGHLNDINSYQPMSTGKIDSFYVYNDEKIGNELRVLLNDIEMYNIDLYMLNTNKELLEYDYKSTKPFIDTFLIPSVERDYKDINTTLTKLEKMIDDTNCIETYLKIDHKFRIKAGLVTGIFDGICLLNLKCDTIIGVINKEELPQRINRIEIKNTIAEIRKAYKDNELFLIIYKLSEFKSNNPYSLPTQNSIIFKE